MCGKRGEQGGKRKGKEGSGEKLQSVFQRQQAVGSYVTRIWLLKMELQVSVCLAGILPVDVNYICPTGSLDDMSVGWAGYRRVPQNTVLQAL